MAMAMAVTEPENGVTETDAPISQSQPPAGVLNRGAPRDSRFWAIIVSLCFISLLASAENTVIVTSLPTIVERLNMGHEYVWVGNIFFLTR